MSYTLCQRCYTARVDHWNIKQAELHIGHIEHWKLQLCPSCTDVVEQAVLAALKPEEKK